MNVQRGPNGSNGCILALVPMSGECGEVGYYPDRQTWIPVGPTDAPKYWLGWNTQKPPTPDTLRRDRIVSGYEYTLGDGHDWTAPTIRRPNGKTNLPEVWGVDPAGAFAARLHPDYDRFWQLAGEMFKVALEQIDWEQPQTFAAAVECLGLNYRVGPHEVSALGLLTSETYPLVFGAAIDAELMKQLIESPAFRELMAELAGDESKKKPDDCDLNLPNSTPGPPGDCQTTNPAAASCS